MTDRGQANVKPLVSPVVEYRIMAVLDIVAGAGLMVLQDPASAPTPAQENTAKTIRRAVLLAGGLLVLAALATLLDVSAHSVAGIALGNGAVLWLASGRLKRWELRSGRRLPVPQPARLQAGRFGA